jgi:hypothetical protein
MLGSTGEGDDRFNRGAGRYSLYYGSREYTAGDPEGNVWSFGTYRPGG